MILDQVEAMLLEIAVGQARSNLSSAARMLGLTQPQLAYRLQHLHESGREDHEVGLVLITDSTVDRP